MSKTILLAMIPLLATLTPAAQADSTHQYPLNLKNRPLILPNGTGELSVGPAFLSGNERTDITPYYNLRFAIQKNLELVLLGFRYRFINERQHQWVVELKNVGINPDLNHHTSLSILGKDAVSENLAIQYSLGAYVAKSHEKDGTSYEIRSTLGGIVKLSERTSIDANFSSRRLSGFNTSTANLIKLNVSHAIKSTLDLVLSYSYSEFNDAVDSVLFNESYKSRLDAGIRWRF